MPGIRTLASYPREHGKVMTLQREFAATSFLDQHPSDLHPKSHFIPQTIIATVLHQRTFSLQHMLIITENHNWI